MKKLLFIATIVVSLLSSAQVRKERGVPFTPEQLAELQVKKMTLTLDLDANQQKELKIFFVKQATLREAKITAIKEKKARGGNFSTDEKYEIKSKKLDDQIAQKEQFKKILSPEQFKKWEQNLENRKEKMSERKEKGKEKRKASQQIEK